MRNEYRTISILTLWIYMLRICDVPIFQVLEKVEEGGEAMSKRAEQKALEVYPYNRAYTDNDVEYDGNFCNRLPYIEGYEQAVKDTIAEVEKWLKANFHHRNCWNADEFCVSLRTYFGIKK